MHRLLVLLLPLALAGCSIRSLATSALADALSGTGDTLSSDDDPELVADASAFGLKTMEGLLPEQPKHLGLITALASGFTQYGYAFVQQDADAAELRGKSQEANQKRTRARKLYLRARDYGLRGLELRSPGVGDKLKTNQGVAQALSPLNKEDVPLVYWTAAAWALAISAGKEDMGLVAELPAAEALVRRGLELDETWDGGALHEFMVSLESARVGGTEASAKKHLDRALELGQGKRLGVLVSWAEGPLVQSQKRDAFEKVLRQVLAADVNAAKESRLANTIAQRRAKLLLDHADDLFN